jgi:hypothetical protein
MPISTPISISISMDAPPTFGATSLAQPRHWLFPLCDKELERM